MLKLLAVAACGVAAADAPAPRMGVCVYSYGRGRFRDAMEFLAHCHEIGAAGVQTGLGTDAKVASKVKEKAEEWGMYVEGQVSMPKTDGDVGKFEAELIAAKAAGASVVRGAMLSGRRYETFETAEAFRKFAKDSWDALMRAEKVLKQQRLRLALENHKDCRIAEMTAMMEKISSEWVGIC